jgi:TetR/AcrR family transcriptional regulator of autoinduction and epiphytic fitness
MSTVKGSAATKPSRRQRAEATQRRIARAAYTLFCEQGYGATTMAQVAEAAGVAIQTVYFAFHTKAGLLSSAYGVAVGGVEEPVIPEQQPWFAEMTAEADISKALRHLVTGSGEIMRRVTPLYFAARVAADADPEAGRVMAFHEKDRAESYRGLVEFLRTKSELRPGVSLERATDLLLLFVGMDVYNALVGGRGWSHDEWIDWTVSVVAEQIFARAPS